MGTLNNDRTYYECFLYRKKRRKLGLVLSVEQARLQLALPHTSPELATRPDFQMSIPFSLVYGASLFPHTAGLNLVVVYAIANKRLGSDGFSNIQLREFRLELASEADATEVQHLILCRVSSVPSLSDCLAKRRLLVILNPEGGERKGLKIYNEKIAPMFRRAWLQVELKISEYPRHATLFANQLELAAYDGVVVVGGDGLYHEVINGLLGRKDWQEACKIPLGLIPAGTSNAVCTSLNMRTPEAAAFAIIKGHTHSMDTIAFLQGQRRFYGHFAFMWGLFADTDIKADQYRHLGHTRIAISIAKRLLRLKTYSGHIRILQRRKDAGLEQSHDLLENKAGRPVLKYQHLLGHQAPLAESANYRITDLHSTSLVSFLALKHPWLDRSLLVSSRVRPDDGKMHLFMLEKAAAAHLRTRLFASLLCGQPGSLHAQSMFAYHQCLALSIVLELPSPKRGQGIFDVDGEEIPYHSIYMECLPKALCMFVPPDYDSDRWDFLP